MTAADSQRLGVRPTADSAAADSARRAGARADSLPTDSLRADTARARKAPPKKRPAATRDCVLDFDESPPETRLVYSRLSETVANTFIGGGFIGHCQGEKNRLKADSAEQFQAAGVVNLYGNVSYEEPGKLRLTATNATYFTREGRLFASGNVVATQLRSGSTLTSNTLEYYREGADGSPSRLVAPGRPVARLVDVDSTGRPAPPIEVTANTLEQRGDTLAIAWGDVVITREQISGTADSARFDASSERARLIRGARIRNLDTAQAFTLTGDTIDLFTTERRLTRVTALHKGTAVSKDVRLESERIDLRLADQQLDEAFASGDGRSRALTGTQEMEADSLHIRLPGQRVREMRAVGGAAARSKPDTLQMVTEDPDLLRGDSLYAWFDSTAASRDAAPGTGQARDTSRVVIREIQAIGSASSLLQTASREGRTRPPNITYARGRRILVEFDSGTVRRVRVDSAASGLFLEPAPDSVADTTASRGRRRSGGQGAPAAGRPPTPLGGGALVPDMNAAAGLPPRRRAPSSLALRPVRYPWERRARGVPAFAAIHD
ncbi:MAG: hypothetical protein KJT01_09420 [Gemmatimonadetes bacterium]|nr:hypothetical protein [Gemmatimonadota bacterium]